MLRHIREINKLPVSELTDEEIVKAAMHRLEADGAGLMYIDKTGQSYFIYRYRNSAGRSFSNLMLNAWGDKFGKMKKLENDEFP